jgi:hypothetical protein
MEWNALTIAVAVTGAVMLGIVGTLEVVKTLVFWYMGVA